MNSFQALSKRGVAIGAALLLLVILVPSPANATTASSDLVLVRESDVVGEDLYATGSRVVIRGTVEGDLVASAFESIVVEGVVEGDITAIAGSVTISGRVGGSVRVVTDALTVSGVIGGDVLVLGRAVRISGEVPRDVLAAAVDLTIDGVIGRDVLAATLGTTRVSGSVGRDVQANGDLLVMDPAATVGGDVRYRGGSDLSDFEVGGTVVHLGDPPTPVRVQALALLASVVGVLGLFITGFLSFWVTPRTTQLAITKVGGWNWIGSFLVGFAALVLPIGVYAFFVVGAGVASPDLAAPAAALASPLLALCFLMISVGLVVGIVPVASRVGSLMARRRSAFAHYVFGLLLSATGVVTLFVWGGPPRLLAGLLVAIYLTVGLGAWVRGAWGARGSMQWISPGPDVSSDRPT